MATYTELYQLAQDSSLIAKVTIAIAVAAEAIRIEDVETANHSARISWATRALFNPDGEARKIMWLLMAQNAAATVGQIQGASDVDILSAVNNAISLFAV